MIFAKVKVDIFMCFGWWFLSLSRLKWLVSAPLKNLEHKSIKLFHHFPEKWFISVSSTYGFQTLISFCPDVFQLFFYLRASSTAPLNTMLTFHILPLGGFRLLMVVCYPMKPFSKGILPEIPGIVNHQLVIDRLGFGIFLILASMDSCWANFNYQPLVRFLHTCCIDEMVSNSE